MRLKQQVTAIATALAIASISQGASAEEMYLNQLPRITGISFSAKEAGAVKVASPYGMFSVAGDGVMSKISKDAGALFEYVEHPKDPQIIYSSGYKSKTEKLGVVKSSDGGRTWQKISNGGKEPIAFRAMAISPSNPEVIFGIDEQLYISRDGGRLWDVVGEVPGDVFDLAVAKDDPKMLYLASREGLLVSTDGGSEWKSDNPEKAPATMVRVDKNGNVFAFLYGQGLAVKLAGKGEWKTLSKNFGQRALVEFAVDNDDPDSMMAATDTGAAVVSADGGKTWRSFEGIAYSTPERIAQGETLFKDNCVACHGENGIGEKPGDPGAKDENGQFVAPALDDSMHGWHHADDQLIETIMEGSPRNERMIAWKEHFSRKDAESLVAYIKSLWSFDSIACQGPRHMSCMR